jgi:ABC-2 type transport system ATP-binding protein
VIFLDEPTTGLDPAARRDLWELMRELVRAGATLLLTTQYLDEADALADRVVVLDHGRVVASGSPDELKTQVGGERLEVTLRDDSSLSPAVAAIAAFAEGPEEVEPEARRITIPLRRGVKLADVLRALDAAGADVDDLHRRGATLDDVFLNLTQRPEEVAA